jgi:Protein of unknown function (DUF1302)
MTVKRSQIPIIAGIGLFAMPAAALPIDTGGELTLNLDTTVEFTLVDQLGSGIFGPSGRCLPNSGPFAVEASLFACAVRSGLTSTRGEVEPRLSASYEGFSFQASAYGEYDPIYSAFKNQSPAMPLIANVTRLFSENGDDDGVNGIELQDAYIAGTVNLADDVPLSFKLGRQVSLWGESLYFLENGFAGAQSPIDTFRYKPIASYEENKQLLPVAQLTVTLQPTAGLAIMGYYQFEGRRDRISPYDAEISTQQILTQDDIRQIVLPRAGGQPVVFNRIQDEASDSIDQFGLGIRKQLGDFDLGLYGASFNAKAPQFDARLPASDSVENPNVGTYDLFFPRDIEIFAASLSGPLGDGSFGAEVSGRRNQPLVNPGIILTPAEETGENDDAKQDADRFPLGDTFHAQFSWIYPIAPLSWLPDGANFSGEIAGNHLIAPTASPQLITPGRTQTAAAIRTVFEPKFYQIMPGIDLTTPLQIGYNLFGLSSFDPTMNRGTGDVTFGANVTLEAGWQLALSGTHYIGVTKNAFLPDSPVGLTQPLSQRDFISLGVKTSF